jgi:hypothetical protein
MDPQCFWSAASGSALENAADPDPEARKFTKINK